MPTLSCYTRLLLALVLLSIFGCASTPSFEPVTRFPDEVERYQIGQIAVACNEESPPISFEPVVSGKGEGAAKGAGAATLSLWNNCPGDGFAALICIALTPIAAVGGSVYGGIAAPSQKDVTVSKERIAKALAEIDVQGGLRLQTLQMVEARWPYPVIAHTPPEGVASAGIVDYQKLASEGIDTVLEVTATRFKTEDSGGVNPLIDIILQADAKLLATASGEVIYQGTHLYRSNAYQYEQWAQNDASLLRDTFLQAYQGIAENIVDNALLSYPLYRVKKSTRAKNYQTEELVGLQALYPTKQSFVIGRVKCDSLQPTLRWEAFPRPADITAENSPLTNARNIRYELRIYRVTNEKSIINNFEVVYYKDDLIYPYHKLEQPLQADSHYYWSVRARFELDGITRVTPWAGIKVSALTTSPAYHQFTLDFFTPPNPAASVQ